MSVHNGTEWMFTMLWNECSRCSGICRKLEGRGKSGGIRVIYYWMVFDDQIYILYGYPKNKQENLTPQQLSVLKTIVERWSDE